VVGELLPVLIPDLGCAPLHTTGCVEGCDRFGHAAPVLAKPFDPDMLVAAVEGLAAATE
jgi:hypothetical protein